MKRTIIVFGLFLALGAFSIFGIVQAHTFPAPLPTKGYVDGWWIQNEGDIVGQTAYISGWAYDPYTPNDSVFVALSTTETVVTQADLITFDSAYNPRPDVAAAFGLENDNFGFEIAIPRELYDGESHTIYVWASNIIEDCAPRGCEPINKNTGQTLIGTVNFTGLNGGIHGAFDTIENNTAYGWAFDADGYLVTEEHVAVLFYACDRLTDFDNVCRNKRYLGGGFTGVERLDVEAAFENDFVGEQQGFEIELNIPSDLRNDRPYKIAAFAVSPSDGLLVRLPGLIERTISSDGSLSE